MRKKSLFLGLCLSAILAFTATGCDSKTTQAVKTLPML